MLKKEKEKFYKHTHLSDVEIKKFAPLMESAFGESMKRYSGANASIKNERINFISGLYANRLRVSKNMGTNPLNEDANIFQALPQVKQLFESAGNISMPSNTIGMPNVVNPQTSNSITGGIWNPSYQAGSGDIPSYVFGLQTHIAANCIGMDLIPTIQVDTPKVVTQYIDTVYGGGALDDKDNAPSYLDFTSKTFNKEFLKKIKAKRAVTKIVIVGDESQSTKNAMEVRFMMSSTIKVGFVGEVLSTGNFTGSTYTATNELSVKEVFDQVNDSGKTSKVFYTNSTGYDASESLSTIKVDYASAIRDAIPQAATNNNSLKMDRAQHEKGPKHKLNVITLDKQFEIEGNEIDADTTNIKIKDLAAQGVNVIAELYNGVQNQLIQTIDYNILDALYKAGVTHAYNHYQTSGEHFSLYLDKPSTTEINFTDIDVEYVDVLGNDVKSEMGKIQNALVSATYENQATHADRFYGRVLLVSEFIGQQTRMGTADFIVVGGKIAAMMKKNSTYTVSPTLNTLTQTPELQYSGTIYETISVYKNEKIDFSDPRILMGRRGDDTDPGLKFFAYDLASSRQIVAEGTMAEKIRVWSRYEIQGIGMYPELNYYTFVAINNFQFI